MPSLWVLILAISGVLAVAGAADIPLGSILTPSNSTGWSSPNGTFTLSFVHSPSRPSLYVAAITYAGGVSIWSAGAAAAVSDSAVLHLLPTGDLQLLNSTSSGAVSATPVWSSNTTGVGVTTATLTDSGNLQLKNSAGDTLWQSFDHPTDTVVTSQSLGLNQSLVAGSYSFALDRSGNLTLRWSDGGGNDHSVVTYFNEGFNSTFIQNRNLSSPTLTIQSIGYVSVVDTSLNLSVVIAHSSNYAESGDMLRFLRLDSDGNFRAYSVTRGTGTATEQWSAVADQCTVFGYCGNYGVCSYNGTSPVCGCPSENFVPVDTRDSTKGCTRTQQLQDCTTNSTMLPLENTEFLTYPPTTEQFFIPITPCRLNCLSGPNCVASTALGDGSGQCFLKVSNFISGYQSAALPSTSYVKVCPPALPNQAPVAGSPDTTSNLTGVKKWVLAVIVVGSVVALVAAEAGLWLAFCRHRPVFGPAATGHYSLLEYASGAPVQFSYRELHRVTRGFTERLGGGGFGSVYRGVLSNNSVVAVKQLEGIEQGEKQFRMEVATISSTHHFNLVRLIGFCSEGRRRLLVYEFMKNGSLDRFLFGDGMLPWPTRFAIAVGAARGITYLHEECRDCIVHCDIKPENILVDESYNAKVSDFGLAKLISHKEHRHRTLTSVRGTRGYLAPEWLANMDITAKSDVYSYGMVLLEIVGGRRNYEVSDDTGRKKFSAWAYEEFNGGKAQNVVDKRLYDGGIDMDQVERALAVSFWCIQEQPALRPTMGKVVQMLEGVVAVERPPPPRSIDSLLSSVSTSLASAFTTPSAAVSSSSAAAASDGLSFGRVRDPTISEISTN